MVKTPFAQKDIVYSSTPLENRLLGIHPRLFATEDRITELRSQLTKAPYDSFLQRIIAVADSKKRPDFQGDTRPYGEWLQHNAVAYRMTQNKRFLKAAVSAIEAMAAEKEWSLSLNYGHWASGMALAYDWLYHHLSPATITLIQQTLADRTEKVYRSWTAYRDAYPLGYAWNHMGVVHGGIMMAGFALWGEINGPGRWLKMSMEKLRLMLLALGPDGASAEGQAYGQYHIDYMVKSMWLAEDLLGEELFKYSEFYKNHPISMIHNMLPHNSWRSRKGGCFPIAFVQTSDTDDVHWHGPDSHLRVIASRLRNGHAQWLADEASAADINGESSTFLNLLAYDPTVKPIAPTREPTLKHFTDKDVVIMRSGWGSDDSLSVFKCGPNSGHHAARHFRHNVAGGHMHPDAAHLMIHAFNEWLIPDDGYTRKETTFQNTLLVNGIGQTGDGAMWFEDLEMRQGKPEGYIVRAAQQRRFDIVTGNAAPAYKPEAGLKTFYRTLLYFRPHLWVVIDEVKTAAPAIFNLRFHGAAPFEPQETPNTWSLTGKHGSLKVAAWASLPFSGTAYKNELVKSPGYPRRTLDGIEFANIRPARAACFITALHAHANSEPASLIAQVTPNGKGLRLRFSGTDFNHSLNCSFSKSKPVTIS
jgi:hypothetical protein